MADAYAAILNMTHLPLAHHRNQMTRVLGLGVLPDSPEFLPVWCERVSLYDCRINPPRQSPSFFYGAVDFYPAFSTAAKIDPAPTRTAAVAIHLV